MTLLSISKAPSPQDKSIIKLFMSIICNNDTKLALDLMRTFKKTKKTFRTIFLLLLCP